MCQKHERPGKTTGNEKAHAEEHRNWSRRDFLTRTGPARRGRFFVGKYARFGIPTQPVDGPIARGRRQRPDFGAHPFRGRQRWPEHGRAVHRPEILPNQADDRRAGGQYLATFARIWNSEHDVRAPKYVAKWPNEGHPQRWLPGAELLAFPIVGHLGDRFRRRNCLARRLDRAVHGCRISGVFGGAANRAARAANRGFDQFDLSFKLGGDGPCGEQPGGILPNCPNRATLSDCHAR